MCLGAFQTCFGPVNKQTAEGVTFHNRTTVYLGESHQNVKVKDYWDLGMEQNTIVIKSYKKLLFAQQFHASPYPKFHLVKTLQLCYILIFQGLRSE